MEREEPLNVPRYAEQATARLVSTLGSSDFDWRGIVEKGMAAAYEQSDADALTSMVQVIAHMLDAQGRFEDAVGEINHALAFARSSVDARILLFGLQAAMLAAPGRFADARAALEEGGALLGKADPRNATKFRIYEKVVRWQALEPEDSADTRELIGLAAEQDLRRERTFLLTWYVPLLATKGDRRGAHPWIRSIRLDAEASKSRWRLSDVAAFEAWDDFMSEPEVRRGRGTFDPGHPLSVWRGEGVHLRDAVLKRDVVAADEALDRMRKARKRIGSAGMGGVEQFEAIRSTLEGISDLPELSPPTAVNLNNLGGWLAAAEAVASSGSQRQASEWFEGLSKALPEEVSSALEWPTSVSRIKGLLALRAGMTRQARAELQHATEWSRAVGFPAEEALALLQLGELCASADFRVPERTWKAQRAAGADGLRRVGYDPVPQAYAVAHSLTLSARNKLAERLTPREVEVLARLAEGGSYRQIGVSLGIAFPTVQTLAHRAYEKLGVSGRTVAVAEAKRLGVL